jgi:hypothetical protein
MASTMTAAQVEHTYSNRAHAFAQASDFAWNLAKHDGIGKLEMSCEVLIAQAGTNGKTAGRVAQAAERLTEMGFSPPQAAGLTAHFC